MIGEIITGRYVDLKPCEEKDANFTLSIRQDPEFSQFFPALNSNVDQQRSWIKSQRIKEGDYFFVVWNKSGERIGTISIYNVENQYAEGGRLAIRSKNPFHAIEAQLLAFRFAFHVLGVECVKGLIFANNTRALRFSKQFGAVLYAPETDEKGRVIVRIENWKSDFLAAEKKINSILYR